MKTITLELRPEDAEPMLRNSAELAAKYGAWRDFIDRRTYDPPLRTGEGLDEGRKRWQELFLKHKRIVEAFGVEYEPTSEGETLTRGFYDKVLKSHLVTVAGMTFRHIDKSEPDRKRPRPEWRRGVHDEACRQAADRVVRRWLSMIEATTPTKAPPLEDRKKAAMAAINQFVADELG